MLKQLAKIRDHAFFLCRGPNFGRFHRNGYNPDRWICRAKTSTRHRSATPTGCPPDKPGWMPMDGRACPCAASARAAAARPTPTVHCSTTRIASCSCKKFSKPTLARRSTQLETESIYETRSSQKPVLRPVLPSWSCEVKNHQDFHIRSPHSLCRFRSASGADSSHYDKMIEI